MKRLISLLSALTLICTMTACSEGSGSSGVSNDSSTAEAMSEGRQLLYSSKPVELEHSFDRAISIQSCGDKGYFFYISGDSELRLAVIDLEGNVLSDKALDKFFFVEYGITVNDDGSFYMLSAETDFPFEYNGTYIENFDDFMADGKITFMLTHFDADCNVISKEEVVGLERDFQLSGSVASGMCPYGDDRLIYSFGNGLALIGTDGTLIEVEHYDGRLINLGTASDGRVIASEIQNYGFMDGETLSLPEELNMDIEFKDRLNIEGNPAKGTGDFVGYIERKESIFGITPDNEMIQVMDLAGSLTSNDEVCKFGYISEDKLIAAGYLTNSVYIYTRRPDDYVEDKITLDLYMVNGGGVSDSITRFNRIQDDYIIRVSTCVFERDLERELISGESPDIIMYSGHGFMDKLINIGAAADMYELMDKYGGLNRDDILPNVLRAFEQDGKLYALPEYFFLEYMIADSRYIGKEYRDWTFDDLYDFYYNRPDDAVLFVDWMDNPLTGLCIDNLAPWVDDSKHTCNFDSPEFVKFLEFLKDADESHLPAPDIGNDEDEFECAVNASKALREHKALVKLDECSIGLQNHISMYGGSGLSFDDAAILNFPNCEGRGYIRSQQVTTVMAGSDCIEGAWAFVSYLLGEEEQCRNARDVGAASNFINKKAFDISLQQSVQKGAEPRIGGFCHSCGDLQFEIKYPYEVTDAQAQEYKKYVESCDRLSYDNSDLTQIIYEEFDRYRNDEITAEECAGFIQNRASIMLSEKS